MAVNHLVYDTEKHSFPQLCHQFAHLGMKAVMAVSARVVWLVALQLVLHAYGYTPAWPWYPPDPTTPTRLRAHAGVQPLNKGFVDVTLPPYNATGDGRADDTAALQAAVADAYAARLTVFLPGGHTFLLSEQLLLLQTERSRSFGFQITGGGSGESRGRDSLARKQARGHGGSTPRPARPVLRLKDGVSSGGGLDQNVFVLFQLRPNGTMGAKSQSEHYNSRIRNVDIDLGSNPAAIGLSMSGSQLCSIEDVSIRGVAFHAGISGLPGSGGFTANVRVEGGEYGIVQDQFRPNPSASGLVLIGQRSAALVVAVSRGPLVVSGFYIDSGANPLPTYRAVLLLNETKGKDNAFSGEDGTIVMQGAGPNTTAIETKGSNVAIQNVFTKGASTLVAGPMAGLSLTTGAERTAWVHATLFVLTASGGQVWDRGHNASNGQSATAYLDAPLTQGAAPPSGALDGHPLLHSWNYSALPTWETQALVDVVLDYGATPHWINDTDDDGARIQEAIADVCSTSSPKHGHVVFVPHGEFNLARPLELHCASLLGSGTHSTSLQPLPHKGGCWGADVRIDGTGGILSTTSAAPLATHTPALPKAQAQVQAQAQGVSGHLQLVSDVSLLTAPLCTFVDFAAGNFLLRDVGFSNGAASTPPPVAAVASTPAASTLGVDSTYHEAAPGSPRPALPGPSPVPPSSVPTKPFVALRQGVQGKFYGLELDGVFGGKNADLGRPHHVLILVEGTGWHEGGPIHFYQPSTEHLVNDKQVLVTNSRSVHFHAWKYESSLNEPKGGPTDSGSLVRISNCSDVSAFGASGNYRLYNSSIPMIDVRGTATCPPALPIFFPPFPFMRGSFASHECSSLHFTSATSGL